MRSFTSGLSLALDSVAVLEKAGGTLERWMDDDP